MIISNMFPYITVGLERFITICAVNSHLSCHYCRLSPVMCIIWYGIICNSFIQRHYLSSNEILKYSFLNFLHIYKCIMEGKVLIYYCDTKQRVVHKRSNFVFPMVWIISISSLKEIVPYLL